MFCPYTVIGARQMPDRSGLPSGVRGRGAERSALPSGVRGMPGLLKLRHCAGAGAHSKSVKAARATAAGNSFFFIRRLLVGSVYTSRPHFDTLKAHRPLAMERLMSDLDRLREIIDTLPPRQVHALLTLLETPQPISDEEFVRRLAEVSEEEVDEETAARI